MLRMISISVRHSFGEHNVTHVINFPQFQNPFQNLNHMYFYIGKGIDI